MREMINSCGCLLLPELSLFEGGIDVSEGFLHCCYYRFLETFPLGYFPLVVVTDLFVSPYQSDCCLPECVSQNRITSFAYASLVSPASRLRSDIIESCIGDKLIYSSKSFNFSDSRHEDDSHEGGYSGYTGVYMLVFEDLFFNFLEIFFEDFFHFNEVGIFKGGFLCEFRDSNTFLCIVKDVFGLPFDVFQFTSGSFSEEVYQFIFFDFSQVFGGFIGLEEFYAGGRAHGVWEDEFNFWEEDVEEVTGSLSDTSDVFFQSVSVGGELFEDRVRFLGVECMEVISCFHSDDDRVYFIGFSHSYEAVSFLFNHEGVYKEDFVMMILEEGGEVDVEVAGGFDADDGVLWGGGEECELVNKFAEAGIGVRELEGMDDFTFRSDEGGLMVVGGSIDSDDEFWDIVHDRSSVFGRGEGRCPRGCSLEIMDSRWRLLLPEPLGEVDFSAREKFPCKEVMPFPRRLDILVIDYFTTCLGF